MASRNVSDLDLSKEASVPEAIVDDVDDPLQSASIRARKKKKIASARGFFQLAETVEKAKWDNEAWRRDFNVSVYWYLDVILFPHSPFSRILSPCTHLCVLYSVLFLPRLWPFDQEFLSLIFLVVSHLKEPF
jgi:hypothetical protein